MNIKNIGIAVIVLSVAGFLLRGCFMGPEGEIRKQLSALQDLVSYEAGEGDLSSLTKVKRLGGLFTEDVEIKLTGFGAARQVKGCQQVQQGSPMRKRN